MKQLGNVLYVMTPDSYLFFRNETVVVKIGGEEKTAIPAHTLESIICFGMNTVSVPLIKFCCESGITLSFCSEYGYFMGRITGPVSGNVMLRKRQYALYDSPDSAGIVRSILYGKLANARMMLMRAAREEDDKTRAELLRSQADVLAGCALQLGETSNIDSMRGIEGTAAASYFRAFEAMQDVQNEEMLFGARTKHPPENRMNALMSFLYMLCKNDVQSALETVGLDTAVGYLHMLRPGRPSLALDIMEELRAPLCDRIALSLTNKRQITAGDFDCTNGEFRMLEKPLKLVISTWQERKRTEIIHPYLKEKIQIGLIPYTQALLMARAIRGEIDGYPPFLWR